MIRYMIMLAVFVVGGFIGAQESKAQYFIPGQAWGTGYNQGYGANWNNYRNYNSYNNYNDNSGTYFERGAHNLPRTVTPYLGGKTKYNPVTEENRYFYPRNNKSMYAPVEYDWHSPHENKSFSFPNVKGVVIPERPVYDRSAGNRK